MSQSTPGPRPTPIPGAAERYLDMLDDDGRDWLRRALSTKAHGCDLVIDRPVMEIEDCALKAWWAAGWIAPDGFAPDLAQRSFHGNATAAHYCTKPMAYWWRPGPEAERVLSGLPRAKGLAVGDRVRYSPHALRSMGMSSDRESKRWRATVVAIGRWVVVDDGERVECRDIPLDLDKYPDAHGPDCELCRGSGISSLRRVSKSALARVRR